jgi:hypothetical protein
MKLKQTALFAVLASAMLIAGCKLQDKWDKMLGDLPKPKNEITINQIIKYPRARKIERQIGTFSGRTIWININSFIHSNVIKKIELAPNKSKNGFYDLKLFMNRRGRLRWMQLSTGFKNQPLAFVIDGIFYRSFIPKPMVGDYDNDENTTYVVIEGPFDKGTAEALVKSAPTNFTYFNDNDDDEF